MLSFLFSMSLMRLEFVFKSASANTKINNPSMIQNFLIILVQSKKKYCLHIIFCRQMSVIGLCASLQI